MTQSDFLDWLHAPPAPSDSIGILAYESENYIVLLQSIGEGQVADGIKITRSAIRAIKELGCVSLSLKIPDG